MLPLIENTSHTSTLLADPQETHLPLQAQRLGFPKNYPIGLKGTSKKLIFEAPNSDELLAQTRTHHRRFQFFYFSLLHRIQVTHIHISLLLGRSVAHSAFCIFVGHGRNFTSQDTLAFWPTCSRSGVAERILYFHGFVKRVPVTDSFCSKKHGFCVKLGRESFFL
jgi:hypothetical protein